MSEKYSYCPSKIGINWTDNVLILSPIAEACYIKLLT